MGDRILLLCLFKNQKMMRRKRIKRLLAKKGRRIFIANAGSHLLMATFSINTKMESNVPSIWHHLTRTQVRKV